ncbi:MAG: zinc/iron-chelating domain-containing protein [Bdellovibrionaceae bacterium]|nr:zinc/iron-chelating domain-containing protein [Pseudobdellovibrionaceae bacterium]|tara:strand:- start:74886 stop:75329 length:444 start_codon:yes stop_codon:yes gene_type:complete
MSKKLWYEEGIRFECQGSGKCCTSHGEYGWVFLSKKDIKRFSEYFELSVSEFKKIYCDQSEGVWHLKEKMDDPDCMFLKDNQCSAYEARPTQCRTWPFWPDTMQAKAWKKEVASFCPGVGKGKLYSKKEIEKQVEEAARVDEELFFS